MAKRRATTELNRDNWDVEDEKEDPGTFRKLNEEELRGRIIRKAKRTLVNNESSGAAPFATFSGFSKSTSSSNPFSFFKKNNDDGGSTPINITPKQLEKKENGSTNVTNSEEDNKSHEMEVTHAKQVTVSGAPEKQKPLRSIEYYRQLQSLNESVMKWMQLHLSKNSCCDFTPVFNDYKKHLDTLNVTYPVKSKEVSEEKKSFLSSVSADANTVLKKSAESTKFKMDNNLKHEDETDYGAHFKSNTTNTSTFSFGIKRTPTATSSISIGPTSSSRKDDSAPEKKPFQFSFGLKNAQAGSSDNSNTSKPFTFASAPTDDTEDSVPASNNEPEYVPPKNDFVAVKEEDAFYSKRCKLFYKKDDTYVERGVGTLHLKPLDGKTQLVVRANTSLGNILLNIVLSESLPMSRTGKNNVLLVCVPNPPVDPKKADSKEAIPMLIRVKTSEDADELLEILTKHKS